VFPNRSTGRSTPSPPNDFLRFMTHPRHHDSVRAHAPLAYTSQSCILKPKTHTKQGLGPAPPRHCSWFSALRATTHSWRCSRPVRSGPSDGTAVSGVAGGGTATGRSLKAREHVRGCAPAEAAGLEAQRPLVRSYAPPAAEICLAPRLIPSGPVVHGDGVTASVSLSQAVASYWSTVTHRMDF
jgi:hypothetical protein